MEIKIPAKRNKYLHKHIKNIHIRHSCLFQIRIAQRHKKLFRVPETVDCGKGVMHQTFAMLLR